MTALNLVARLAARRRRRETLAALSALSDHQLADIGIRRFDIPHLAAGRGAPFAAPGGAHSPVRDRLALAR